MTAPHDSRLLYVCRARPNFMKVAPVMAAVEASIDLGALASGLGGAPVRAAQALVRTGWVRGRH